MPIIVFVMYVFNETIGLKTNETLVLKIIPLHKTYGGTMLNTRIANGSSIQLLNLGFISISFMHVFYFAYALRKKVHK